MDIAGQTDGKSTVSWETDLLPKDLDPAKPFMFRWVAGLGYLGEPAGKLTLYLNGLALLDLHVTNRSAIWGSADGKSVLEYVVTSAGREDSSGLMRLSVPAALLKPGEPAQLRVTGSAAHSRRWFGLYEVDF